MAWLWNDAKSLFPSNPPPLSAVPQVGDDAPQTSLPSASKSLVLFQRHLGCPFCELTTRNAIDSAKDHTEITYFIVMHAEESDIDEYINDMDLKQIPNNVRFIPDPERQIYASYGVGEIGFSQIFSYEGLRKVGELREQGIKNRLTVGTRWQNSAAVGIVDEKVRYVHIAKDAADTANIPEAIASLN